MSEIPQILTAFESTFDPVDLRKSSVPAELVGYGEISAILSIEGIEGLVFKRMPLFSSDRQAQQYLVNYYEYCRLLAETGVELPSHECYIIPKNARCFVLYIGQERFPAPDFCHQRLHRQSDEENVRIMDRIIDRFNAIWAFNRTHGPEREIAIDGQFSNWVLRETPEGSRMFFIDTSTPLFRRGGVETMDPELILKSAPGPLRAIIRLFFLDDVMNRYYRPRDVYMDLLGNLYKEHRPDLVPLFLERINGHLPATDQISGRDVARFYKQDKFIWQFFLNARRIDRWVKRRLLGRPYEFLLPGRIER